LDKAKDSIKCHGNGFIANNFKEILNWLKYDHRLEIHVKNKSGQGAGGNTMSLLDHHKNIYKPGNKLTSQDLIDQVNHSIDLIENDKDWYY